MGKTDRSPPRKLQGPLQHVRAVEGFDIEQGPKLNALFKWEQRMPKGQKTSTKPRLTRPAGPGTS